MGRGGEAELLATFKSSISSCIGMVGRMAARDRIAVRDVFLNHFADWSNTSLSYNKAFLCLLNSCLLQGG